jgi:hypothetical protein
MILLSNDQLNIVKFCAEECERQGSGELSVGWMVDAWRVAEGEYINNPHPGHSRRRDLDLISRLGQLVEPAKNRNGFREIPIGVSDGFNWIEKAQWDSIPRLLHFLIQSYYDGRLDPEDTKMSSRTHEDWGKYKYYKKAKTAEDIFYFEYEEIHPFQDGNGRTGKILYNYLKGTLDNPQLPPNFWNTVNL